MKLGHLTVVKNTQRKFGSPVEYLHVRVMVPSQESTDLLLTWSEVTSAQTRARANPEDLPRRWSFKRRLAFWWAKLTMRRPVV